MSSVQQSSGIVSLAVMSSRVLGLVRELIFAAMFGAGKFLDAFLAGFQIPNLLRDLFAEGALSTAFTATFTKLWETDGEKPAWALLNLMLSTVILVVCALCILGILFATPIVHVTNFGFHQAPGKFELAVDLTRIMFPFILFVSLAAAVMGALNARFVFGLPASASTVFNAVSIVFGVWFAFMFDPQADWRHPRFGPRALYGVSLGVLLGGGAQLAVQMPALWRRGFRWRWRIDFRDEALRRVWRLMWPSFIAGSAIQVNVLVNGMFASEIDGARSWLACAFRLTQFPIGVFGVAIVMVTLPAAARHHARDDLKAFGRAVEEALRLAFFLTLPAAAGLFALAPEIVRAIYRHGAFSESAAVQTALALRAYVMGLAGYAAIKILVPCFYALDRPRAPLKVSLLGIAINLLLNITLVKLLHMGHQGLALSTAALATVNFLQLVVYLSRRVSLGCAADWYEFTAKVVFSAGLSAALAFLAARVAGDRAAGFTGLLLGLAAGLTTGAGSYLLLTALLRVPESAALWRMLRRGNWGSVVGGR
ncbi:MAG: murein biosynthesis integral membrane protein MurJ [Verrucomicrobiota bacterium]|nr:murein biosynthesis integral membrane protein MurJ [Verrucomicrobiota bacterium]